MDVVVHDLVAEVSDGGRSELVPLTLKFYKSDPLAVSLVFNQYGDEILWQVSREFLSNGLTEQAGNGDVLFWPILTKDWVYNKLAIWLDGGSGSAYLTVNLEEVKDFLDQAAELMPLGDGEEELLIMSELDEWLGSAR